MTYSEKLKVIRKKLKLTQAAMADNLGIKQSYYSEIERGEKEVSGNVLKNLFESSDVSPDWFYNDSGNIFITANSNIKAIKNEDLNKDFVSKMIRETKNNPNYAIAKNLYFQISGDHNQDLKNMIMTFNKFLENIKLLMQFIRQYDFIIDHPAPHLNIMYLLNSKSKEDIENEFKIMFSNLPKVLSIINKLNGSFSHCIEDLRKYDMNHELDKRYFDDIKTLLKEYKQLLSESKKDEAAAKEYEALDLENIYDLLKIAYQK